MTILENGWVGQLGTWVRRRGALLKQLRLRLLEISFKPFLRGLVSSIPLVLREPGLKILTLLRIIATFIKLITLEQRC